MPEVDPDDDTIEWYVVRHYRYDHQRSERRHVVVAAYDNEQEFEARIQQESDLLENRRASGESVDPREHVTGDLRQAGHAHLAANGRLVKRAFSHGVWGGEWVDELDLPSNMWVMRSSDSSVESHGSSDDG